MKRTILLILLLVSGIINVCASEAYLLKMNEQGEWAPYAPTRQLGFVQSNIGANGIDINQRGNYILARNTSASAASGVIRISSDEVVLDLNGFNVTNDSGLGISVTGTDITLKNGYITSCSGTGLEISGSGRVNIYNINTNENNVGISCSQSSDLKITECYSVGNTFTGIKIETTERLRIDHINSSTNGNDGISFSNCNDLVFSNSLLSSNGSVAGSFHGLNASFLETAIINHVRCLSTIGTGAETSGVGMFFSGERETNLSIEHCEVMGNAGNGIRIAGDSSVLANRIQYLLVKDCTIYDSGHTGIFISNASGITIRDNKLVNNGTNGIRINEGSASSNTNRASVYDNDVLNNGGDGIDVTGLTDGLVSRNRLIGNSGNGVLANSPVLAVNVIGNEAIENGSFGFNGNSSNDVVFNNNVSRSNTSGGYSGMGSQSPLSAAPAFAAFWHNLDL